MGKPDFAFDADTYTRTASMFTAKRETFTPDAIQAIAADIVSRLAEAAQSGPRFEAPDISEEEFAGFCEALINPEPIAALEFIEGQRARGLTRQGVYIGYVAAAARWLGEQWDDDRLSSLQVTAATGHLYALMRAVRAGRPNTTAPVDSRHSALFATVPGEDHGIGITVAANVFREAGWDIDLQLGVGHDALIAHVEQTEPHVIGLSLSTEERLDALVRLVVALRLQAPYAIIGVAPARTMGEDRLRSLVDIDLVFTDIQTACADLDRKVRLRT